MIAIKNLFSTKDKSTTKTSPKSISIKLLQIRGSSKNSEISTKTRVRKRLVIRIQHQGGNSKVLRRLKKIVKMKNLMLIFSSMNYHLITREIKINKLMGLSTNFNTFKNKKIGINLNLIP